MSASALVDTTRPTILSVSPMNNEMGLTRNEQISILFSEEMDPSTLNRDTIIMMQRTTPESGGYKSLAIDGSVTYTDRTATFTSTELFTPNQHYGNVFTVMITTGAQDLAGNSLSQDYFWSFTTGQDLFNTGATTSQLGQSAAPISGTNTQIPVVAPVTGTQSSTANNFPWIWVIGGILGVILIAVIIALALPVRDKDTKKDLKTPVNTNTERPNPFGDVHPVMDIEGIGPEYKSRLNEMGISNTQQLWNADAVEVAHETSAPLSSVKSWQQMAELASVKDIGPQYAELLERSGVHSITQLKNYDPNKLLKLIRKKMASLKVNIQGNSPGHATVEHWINRARDHKFHGYGGQTA
ncbi:MAG: DUF4332 domain-containing protein [Candidatus Woesearchaeota archaeon]